MALYQTVEPPRLENPQIAELTAKIEAEKALIRECCIRMGKAHYDAHKADPEETMEDDVRRVRDATESIRDCQQKIREIKGLVVCPTCKAEIKAEVVFCNYCGHRMKEPEPEPQPAQEAPVLVCEGCGRPLQAGQRFCAGCGRPVADAAPEAPAEPKLCANCGTPLRDGAKFCFKCGTPVA